MSSDRSIVLFLVLAILAYLVGGFPFSIWIGRIVGGVDIRRHGSGNPGAANVWRTVGRPWGVIVGAFDAAKGAVMVFAAWGAGLDDGLACWVGSAAVIGHNFSPWLRLSGGKGGATTVGMLACFIFPELLVVFFLWLIGWLILPRHRFLWSMISLSLTPAIVAVTGRIGGVPWLALLPPRPPAVLIATVLLLALLWVRVIPGMRSPRHA